MVSMNWESLLGGVPTRRVVVVGGRFGGSPV